MSSIPSNNQLGYAVEQQASNYAFDESIPEEPKATAGPFAKADRTPVFANQPDGSVLINRLPESDELSEEYRRRFNDNPFLAINALAGTYNHERDEVLPLIFNQMDTARELTPVGMLAAKWETPDGRKEDLTLERLDEISDITGYSRDQVISLITNEPELLAQEYVKGKVMELSGEDGYVTKQMQIPGSFQNQIRDNDKWAWLEWTFANNGYTSRVDYELQRIGGLTATMFTDIISAGGSAISRMQSFFSAENARIVSGMTREEYEQSIGYQFLSDEEYEESIKGVVNASRSGAATFKDDAEFFEAWGQLQQSEFARNPVETESSIYNYLVQPATGTLPSLLTGLALGPAGPAFIGLSYGSGTYNRLRAENVSPLASGLAGGVGIVAATLGGGIELNNFRRLVNPTSPMGLFSRQFAQNVATAAVSNATQSAGQSIAYASAKAYEGDAPFIETLWNDRANWVAEAYGGAATALIGGILRVPAVAAYQHRTMLFNRSFTEMRDAYMQTQSFENNDAYASAELTGIAAKHGASTIYISPTTLESRNVSRETILDAVNVTAEEYSDAIENDSVIPVAIGDAVVLDSRIIKEGGESIADTLRLNPNDPSFADFEATAEEVNSVIGMAEQIIIEQSNTEAQGRPSERPNRLSVWHAGLRAFGMTKDEADVLTAYFQAQATQSAEKWGISLEQWLERADVQLQFDTTLANAGRMQRYKRLMDSLRGGEQTEASPATNTIPSPQSVIDATADEYWINEAVDTVLDQFGISDLSALGLSDEQAGLLRDQLSGFINEGRQVFDLNAIANDFGFELPPQPQQSQPITETEQGTVSDGVYPVDQITEPLARIKYFGDANNPTIIELMRNASVLDVLHELNHLSVLDLRDMVSQGRGGEQAAADLQTLTEYAGGELNTAGLERIARAAERYYSTGDAPTIDLQRSFDKMRSWLSAVYRGSRDSGDIVSPEVSQVFDRMLASDQQIVDSESAFRDIGYIEELLSDVTEEERSRMTEIRERARHRKRSAEDENRLAFSMQNFTPENVARMIDEERQNVPAYRAIDSIRNAGGISNDAIEAYAGNDAVRNIPSKHGAGIAGGTLSGVDLLNVASEQGYSSIDEMMSDISQIESIENAVYRRIAEEAQNADVQNRVNAENEGSNAIDDGTSDHEEVVLAELDLLDSRSGLSPQQAVESRNRRQAFRIVARRNILSMKARDGQDVRRFQADEVRAAKAAAKAVNVNLRENVADIQRITADRIRADQQAAVNNVREAQRDLRNAIRVARSVERSSQRNMARDANAAISELQRQSREALRTEQRFADNELRQANALLSRIKQRQYQIARSFQRAEQRDANLQRKQAARDSLDAITQVYDQLRDAISENNKATLAEIRISNASVQQDLVANRSAIRSELSRARNSDYDEAIRQKEIQLLKHYHVVEARGVRALMQRTARYSDSNIRGVINQGANNRRARVELSYVDPILALAEFMGWTTDERNFPQAESATLIIPNNSEAGDVGMLAPDVSSTMPEWMILKQRPDGFTDKFDFTGEQVSEALRIMEKYVDVGRGELNALRSQQAQNLHELVEASIDTMKIRDDRPLVYTDRAFAKTRNAFNRAALAITLPEVMFQYMDGNPTIQGEQIGVNQNLFLKVRDAEGREANRIEAIYNSGLHSALVAISDESRSWSKKYGNEFTLPWLPVPDIYKQKDVTKWNFEMLTSLMFHWGNDANRYAITEGFGITNDQMARLFSEMPTSVVNAVQQVWDSIDSMYPDLDAVYRRIYNRPMTREEAMPFTVISRDGDTIDVRGGYYPLVYDPLLNRNVQRNNDIQESLYSNQRAAAFRSALPANGFTMARLRDADGNPTVGYPPLLKTSVLSDHIDFAAHFTEYAEILSELDRLTRDEVWSGTYISKFGIDAYNEIRNWIQYQARPDKIPEGAIAKGLNKLRSWATTSALGLRVRTSLRQRQGLFQAYSIMLDNSMTKTNPLKYLSKAIRSMGIKGNIGLRSPIIDIVNEKSNYMKTREGRIIDEIRRLNSSINPFGDEFTVPGTDIHFSKSHIRNAAFFLIQMNDRASAYGVWLAAYYQGMAGDANFDPSVITRGITDPELAQEALDREAVKYADTVASTQSSSFKADLTSIQRDRGFLSHLTMFMSGNVRQASRVLQYIDANDLGKKSKADIFMLMLREFVFPALAWSLSKAAYYELLNPKDDPFDDFLTDLSYETFGNAAAPFPILRELPSAIQYGRGGEIPALSTPLRMLGGLVTVPKNISEEEYEKAFFKVGDALSFGTQIPFTNTLREVRSLANDISGEE